jgi:hypothetical protein
MYMISYNKKKFDIFANFLEGPNDIEKEIKSYPGWCKCFDTAWLIATPESIETVSKKFEKYFEKDDFWMVANVGGQICGGMSPAAWKWINDSKNVRF